MDNDLAFTGEIIQFILRAIYCQYKRIGLFNDSSLITEIQTICKIMTKHLTLEGEMSPLIVAVVAYARNTFAPPPISGFSLFERGFV